MTQDAISRDDIIEMARQAGFHEHDFPFKKFKFEAFAKLVAEAAASKEREACAKVCGRLADEALVAGDEDAVMCFEEAEDLIRARGEPTSRGET